jgi:hypothetical protein
MTIHLPNDLETSIQAAAQSGRFACGELVGAGLPDRSTGSWHQTAEMIQEDRKIREPQRTLRSRREKHGETGWSPDKSQRLAVDRGDQTIPDWNGRLRRTCVEFSP